MPPPVLPASAPAEPLHSSTLTFVPSEAQQEQQAPVVANIDAVLDAQRHDYDRALRNLAGRPEAVGRSLQELLQALLVTNGLVNPAKRLL